MISIFLNSLLIFAVSALAAVSGSQTAALVVSYLPSPAYVASQRLVNNWRLQSALKLDLDENSLSDLLHVTPGGFKPRCIKMNNYWCIKHSNWNGEIAYDLEGHVAFASAGEGALAAAVLLRRYYIDFHLTSAKAIISRWAPPDCGLGQVSATTARALAPRGLRNTLRARFLASNKGGRKRLTPSRVRAIIIPSMRAPAIMSGGGEASSSTKLASLGTGTSGPVLILPKLSASSCPSEDARLAAYIKAAGNDIPLGKDDDLGLFNADGQPMPALGKLMANMSAVEIGPYQPLHSLIDLALAQLAALPAPKRTTP